MKPTPEQLRDELLVRFPKFESQWRASLFIGEDKEYTYCGLFSEFSWFVRDNFDRMDEQQKAELFVLLESFVTGDNRDDLDNAVCTCFLENLAGEPPLSENLRRYLGSRSRKYFDLWNS